MKNLICLAILAVVVGCGGVKIDETVRLTNGANSSGRIAGDVAIKKARKNDVSNFSTNERVGGLITYLASDELKGREAGSEGIDMAAKYIEGIFRNNGVKPYFESYRDTLTNFEKPAYNVVGYLEGTDKNLKNEFVIIGAHYDHIGTADPVSGDHIANGANDNASGTTAVLEFARYFGRFGKNKRSIIFALFSAEEKGLLGSKHLAKKLKEKNLNLYAMLNFEMVGVPLVGKDYFMYVTGYEESNLADICNGYAKEKLVGFLPTAKEFNLFQRSDNYPFHTEFGVPSQTFCTFDFTNFDHYHKVGDEVSIMDFDHTALLVNKTIPVLKDIINAPNREIEYK
ncbi:M20/M25/M40 family metallo-hydrolase [Arenibacter sp. BSSL-BM3]|uniref:M20/M25/M40 family metallo-hydrolase n=1 Tax=Arenibacter arenosicollis TaxID=2762274 RepID=A0ABR7QKD3_9FLAO|nr:M20/M25/M40 family metallo-hydrolase [Arenibacter arenosicollis]MBC8767651.1 M20/M25/M40 family metallo-hydrolase [Arenibacter arenosicollis]